MYLRSTMSQDRLSNSALLYIERDSSSQLWDKMDELIIRFAETHSNSRIVLFVLINNLLITIVLIDHAYYEY